MNTLAFLYSYSKSNEKDLDELLDSLEKELGGIRKPYWAQAGAIDLVTILQIVVSFIAGASLQPLVEKYFEGLLNGEKFKSLGEQHREKISLWLVDIKADIESSIQSLKFLADVHITSDFLRHETEYAVALTYYLGEIPLYVVINHTAMSSDLIRNIPDGVMKAIQFVVENELPDDIHALQLYFDKPSNRWKYLLAPTNKGFGRWIDQYIDLDTQKICKIESRREFLETFHPDSKDELKFLVSPFIEPRC